MLDRTFDVEESDDATNSGRSTSGCIDSANFRGRLGKDRW